MRGRRDSFTRIIIRTVVCGEAERYSPAECTRNVVAGKPELMTDSGLEGKLAPNVLPPPWFAKHDLGYLGVVTFGLL